MNDSETISSLILRSGVKTRIVNLITLYRIIVCPILLFLVFNHSLLFKWLLLSAFLTDIADGFLARAFKVTTKLGSKLDSLADDCLFIVSLIAVLYLYTEIITENIIIISVTLFIFFLKMIFLFLKHRKIISSMHTYFTKAAAFLQAVFFLDCVFFQTSNILFSITIYMTMLALMEELVIIYCFRDLKQNVKGIFFNNIT